MEFRVLGPLEVVDGGRPVELGGPQQQALLGVLLLHAGRSVPAERLVGELWGERPPPTALRSLQVNVSRARRALDRPGRPPVLVTRVPGWLADVPPDELDAARFERLAHEGARALADGDAGGAAEALGQALALWRGPPLAGLALGPAGRAAASRLEELRLAAVEDRADADLALGRHVALAAELPALVRAHPRRERLLALLLLALARCGRHADALAAYREARERLLDELGIEPGSELRRLGAELASVAGGEANPDTGGGSAPLVARTRELDLLADSFERAAARRTPQLVTVLGEPGIGKTRLAAELRARLADRPASEDDAEPVAPRWLRGRSLPYGDGVTFWALGAMVKGAAGILETDDASEAAGKLSATVEHLLGPGADVPWVEEALRPLVGLATSGADGGGRPADPFPPWRRFVEALADERPLVLLFEDLHWADDALLDFVDDLVDWASGVPLLVLCTARPELLERRPGWCGGKPNAATFSLRPLSDDDTARLLARLLDGAGLPDAAERALLARAGGNPLYAEEYVRMLRDRGALSDGGAALLAEGDVPLPETVQALIASRLEALPRAEKRVLRDAAVLGSVFWDGGLRALDAEATAGLDAVLRQLERRDIVARRRRSSLAGQREYAFAHVLVKDVAYAQLPDELRATQHERAAAWIEGVSPDRDADRLEMLAHHLERAARFAPAAGLPPDELRARARRAYREAGERALSLTAAAAADRLFSAALALTAPDDPERPALLFRHGVARYRAGRPAEDLLAEAVDALLERRDRGTAALAEATLAELLWLEGRRDDAFPRLERAAALVDGAPDTAAKASVLVTVARFHALAGRHEAALGYAREGAAIAEHAGSRVLRANALMALGMIRATSGDRDGLADLERGVTAAADAASPLAVRGAANLGHLHAVFGDLRTAWRWCERSRRDAARFGDAPMRRWVDGLRVEEDYWAGAWDRCVAGADALLAGPAHYLGGTVLAVRGRVRLLRGELDAAAADAAAALALGRRAKDPQVLEPALAFHARVCGARGLREEALAGLHELLGGYGERRDPIDPHSAADAGEASALTGAGAGPLAEATGGLPRTPWLEAALAVAAGDDETAAGLYEAIGSGPDEAVARLRAATRLEGAGRTAEAAAHRGRAIAFLEPVGAAPPPNAVR